MSDREQDRARLVEVMAPRRKGEDLFAFIERKSAPEPNSGCLIWLGWVSNTGYGRMWLNGRNHGVHRVAYETRVGRIPRGMVVCHRCDVRLCVNPSHLFLGTNDENMADMVKKGRQAAGNRVKSAKLTPPEVAEIRALKGTATQRAIARRFGVSQIQISRIQEGKRWTRAGFRIEGPADG